MSGIVMSAMMKPGGLALSSSAIAARACVDPCAEEAFVAQHLDDQRVHLCVVVDHQHPPGK